jgi:hypothetical protein
MKSKAVALTVFSAAISCALSFGAERVVRQNRDDTIITQPPFLGTQRTQVFIGNLAKYPCDGVAPAFRARCDTDFRSKQSFEVYTTTEIDTQIAALKIGDLNATIAQLKQDVKGLSAANDALTKRLEALEKRTQPGR